MWEYEDTEQCETEGWHLEGEGRLRPEEGLPKGPELQASSAILPAYSTSYLLT